MMNEAFILLIQMLTARLGRIPTEDEVMTFINDETQRERIWNQENQCS